MTDQTKKITDCTCLEVCKDNLVACYGCIADAMAKDRAIVIIAAEVRVAQKDYFKSRRTTALQRSKSLEKDLDRMLAERVRPTLFPDPNEKPKDLNLPFGRDYRSG